MKITFVIPESAKSYSFLQPCLGALKTAAVMEGLFGHKFTIIDNRVERLPLNVLTQRVEATSPELLLTTTTTYDMSQVYLLGPRLNKVLDTVRAIGNLNYPYGVCGPHASTNPELLIQQISCDFLIQGQFDVTIPLQFDKLQDAIRTGTDWRTKPSHPAIISQPHKYPLEWDELIPPYHKVPMERYFGDDMQRNVVKHKSNWGVILASRGCSYKCEFCYCFLGERVRRRSIESVTEEIRLLNNRFKATGFFFLDYTFTLNKKWVLELCNLLKTLGLTEMRWACQTRPDLLDEELLSAMKSAGCSDIWLGIESFAPPVLETANKKNDPNIMRENIKLVQAFGIQPIAYIILGLPGETPDTLRTTLSYLRDLELTYLDGIELATPRPGCRLFDRFKDEFPRLAKSWEYVETASGLLGNEVTPGMLLAAFNWMAQRDSIYTKRELPKFTTNSFDRECKDRIIELGRTVV